MDKIKIVIIGGPTAGGKSEIAVRAGGVAPDALFGFGFAGVDDGLRGAEIHVRHPQGDDVGGAELLDPLVVLGGAVLAAVNDLIEIVLHTRLLCFGRLWTEAPVGRRGRPCFDPTIPKSGRFVQRGAFSCAETIFGESFLKVE